MIALSRVFKAFLENEDALRRFLRRFPITAQDVEDISQETFLKGFAAEMRSEIRQPRAFLFQIAKNTALAEIRKRKRSPTDQLEDFGGSDLILDEGQPSALETLDGRRKLTVFAKAVASLPPKCRKAFLMRWMEGLQYKQIANRMNISVSAVEKHVTSGLLKCNAYLREQGYDASEFGAVSKVSMGSSPRVMENVVEKNERD